VSDGTTTSAAGAGARALLDGREPDGDWVLDRGLHYGDGLFETLRCRGGRPCWFDLHHARLALGCERLGIAVPAASTLRAEAARLLAGAPDGMMKILVTRGRARARGYRPRGDEEPTRLVLLYPGAAASPGPLRLGHAAAPLSCNPRLAGIKHLNRLEQVLAQREAAALGVDEVIMFTPDGRPACASAANLFLLSGDELLTPPLEDCGVAGIVRGRVLALAARAGLRVQVRQFGHDELRGAAGLFISNVRLGLQAVNWYQGRNLEPDARCQRLRDLIEADADES
jgi:4-amino-4-deoxychorismate lyase